MVYGFMGQQRTGMTITTIHDIVDVLKDHEWDAKLEPAPKDRWAFRFSKDYMIIMGKDRQRMALSARSPDQVIMRYSVE